MIGINSKHHQQKGAVLITAILVVSLVAIIATTLIQQQSRMVRLGYSLRHMDQTYLFWDQYERFYLGQMGDLLKQNDFNVAKVDNLIKQQGGAFASGGDDELVCLRQELEEQGITINIEGLAAVDIQGRFDLNSLRNTNGTIDPNKLKILQRLLVAIEDYVNLPPSINSTNLINSTSPTGSQPTQDPLELDEQVIADSIADWMDSDSTAKSYGAEDDFYQGLDIAYRTPGNWMTDISELKLIKGIADQEDDAIRSRIYQELSKHITVLPTVIKSGQNGTTQTPRNAKLDINRASIPVLQSLHQNFSSNDALRLQDGRGTNGYKSLDDFWKEVAVQKTEDEIKQAISLGVEGQYFLVWGTLATGLGRAPASSLLEVDKQGKVTTLWRSRMFERKPSCQL
ncbi:type II secretion system minor pseudopilin GspK [Pelagibaculum spongiae]|uniref:Type II secretion system protein K n=1 Tax=Pelagibaculum spongiae TaxID=2080658 RepID=A0A2V1GY64_9GAMM|nr:type II secretion system minor pseudopilin GspK [Pelagibaculum spongiae]PVZ67604.1 hypothetical protein DC094_14285 [Pelagibaculum spongiae]